MSKAERPTYLIRHGDAEDTHLLGDGARALTADGRAELRAHAKELRKHMDLRGLATSPLVRAVQTAEIFAEAFELDDVVVHDALKYPGASAQSIGGLARQLGPGYALVGHNPSLSEALSQLTANDDPPKFRKGAVAALLPSPSGVWHLDWLRAPGRKPQR